MPVTALQLARTEEASVMRGEPSTSGPNDFETQSLHISLTNLSGHSTTGTLAH